MTVIIGIDSHKASHTEWLSAVTNTRWLRKGASHLPADGKVVGLGEAA
jgi:hypothetical protein